MSGLVGAAAIAVELQTCVVLGAVENASVVAVGAFGVRSCAAGRGRCWQFFEKGCGVGFVEARVVQENAYLILLFIVNQLFCDQKIQCSNFFFFYFYKPNRRVSHHQYL